jgi:uncharacterized protein
LKNFLLILAVFICQACTSISDKNVVLDYAPGTLIDANAQYRLGLDYETGRGVPKNMEQSNIWVERAALQGLAKAQYALASIYLTGHTLDDDRVALKWFQISTDQGYSQAQIHFGWKSDHVEKIPHNIKMEIAKNYQLAAQQGDAKAQYALAWFYKEWVGDFDQEFYWFQRAADQGHMAAENRLGIFSQQFNNFHEALYWYRRSAAQGYDAAQVNLGIMYWNGQGVQENKGEAIRLIALAVDQEGPVAQFDLGIIYTYEKEYLNFPEGLRLLRLAANQGYAQARDTLDILRLNQIPSAFRLPSNLAPTWIVQ